MNTNRHFVFKEQHGQGETGRALAATLCGDRIDLHVYSWNEEDGQTCLGVSLDSDNARRFAEWLLQASD